MPTISVIVPVYNGEKYLEEALASILRQSFEDFELIVIDDGSNDRSQQIVKNNSDARIRLISNENNRGVATSLNEAIRVSQGNYIARMDADDIAFPNRLQKQFDFLENHRDISICGSAVSTFGVEEQIFTYPQKHSELLVDLLFKPSFAHPAVMWRKSDFIKHNLWYQEEPPTAEDYDLWEKASQKVKLANLPEVLLAYRMDPQVKVSSYLQEQNSGHREIKKRLLARLNLPHDDESVNEYIAFSGGPSNAVCDAKQRFDWGERLFEANQQLKLYDSVYLLDRIHEQLYAMTLEESTDRRLYISLYKDSSLPFSLRKKTFSLGKALVKSIF